MLDNMLCNIVAILIGYEHRSTLMKLLEYSSLIFGGTIFQHPLNYTTTIGMGSQSMHLAFEGVNDELDMFCWDSLNCFLDNMVAMLVFDTLENVYLEFFNELGLLVSEDMFKSLIRLASCRGTRFLNLTHLLHHSATIRLQ